MNDLFYMASLEQPYHESKTFIPVECIDGLLILHNMMFRGEKTYLTDLIFMMYLNHLNLEKQDIQLVYLYSAMLGVSIIILM